MIRELISTLFANRFLSGGAIRRIFSFIIPVFIFCAVLYGLLFLFNKNEDKKLSGEETTHTPIKAGTPEILPAWREFAQFPPSSVYRARKTFDGNVVYDVTYTTNQNALRVNPVPPKKSSAHFIFGGCSMTFGVGVNDSETYPARLGEFREDLDVVNFAFGGGGPNLLLRALENYRFKDLTEQKTGTFVYVFIADHFNRWFLKSSYLAWVPPFYPHYETINGKVIYRGSIGEQPKYQEFHKLKNAGLDKTFIKAEASLSEPGKWSDQEVKEFMGAILEIRKKYLESFPNGNFRFMFHPTHGTGRELISQIYSAADENGIKILNPTEDFHQYFVEHNLKEGDLNIKHDGHGTPEMNTFIAKWLIQHELI